MTVGPVDTSLTAQEATELALLYTRHAIKRIETGADGRHYDPSLYGRLVSAEAPLHPAVELAKPAHDQAVVEEPLR